MIGKLQKPLDRSTGSFNYRLNQAYNDELERQVDAISSSEKGRVTSHFNLLMRWNIRLSDFETWNYVAIWLGVIALLVFSPIAIIDSDQVQYGAAFAVMLYVFQYIDALVTLPFFIQQAIRLKEISTRLNN